MLRVCTEAYLLKMLRNVRNFEESSAGLSETKAVSMELLFTSLFVGVDAPVDVVDDVFSLVVEFSLEEGFDMVLEHTAPQQSPLVSKHSRKELRCEELSGKLRVTYNTEAPQDACGYDDVGQLAPKYNQL